MGNTVNHKDPAFLFYSSDFMIGTMDMTDEEVGKYIRLLCRQHLKGNIHPKFMSDLSEEILSKFVQDNQGNYYNRRLKQEIDKRKKFTESRRSNGSKGGRPRKPKEKPEESIEKPYGFSQDNHMGNENINENNIDLTDPDHLTDQEDLTEEKTKKKNSSLSNMGEFQNVSLSEEELEKLKERFPYDWQERIENLSVYMKSKGRRYKSHYATILNWARKEGNHESKQADSKAEGRAGSAAGTGDEYEKFFK